ncbi:response regulator transcription factor [Streptomyces roseochromogenus]|uniref:response regulator transcription factor n=1 Tax=Streptomyces roseochromogenus TaxID=285450 RepID=UPI000AE54CFC|nr:LuxR C-terminal-related transcriptional regulator [Streptomyces roseochromogenus]
MTAEPLGPLALARIRTSVKRNPDHPAARTIQLLLDEIDRLKSPVALAEWHPDAECPLTRRQLEILARTANGETCEQIGPQIGIDPKSVRKHRQAIMRRLSVRSTPSAVAVCLVNGWIPDGVLHLPRHQRRMSTVVARNTYRERAAVLRQTPGEWGTVAVYDSGATARQSAYRLRTGAFVAFRPAGKWEAEAFTSDGVHGVRARFTGTPTTIERQAS